MNAGDMTKDDMRAEIKRLRKRNTELTACIDDIWSHVHKTPRQTYDGLVRSIIEKHGVEPCQK